MTLNDPWIAALAALFLWWFSTGAILVVVRLADRRGRAARLGAALLSLPLLGLGVWGYLVTLESTGPAAAYHGFLAALAIWGWIELAFLTGVITGPNLRACPEPLPEWERFMRAWGTVAYHEMALLGALVAMALVGWDAANGYGLWTFLVLYVARVSAKLNLYLGVPRINTEFIPLALAHLPSHFRMRRMNVLYPVSIVGLGVAVMWFVGLLLRATQAGDVVGLALLAAITALALVEHLLMVVPLPDAKLWRWMLPAPKRSKGKVERTHGF